LFVERQEERLKTNNRDLSMASIVFKGVIDYADYCATALMLYCEHFLLM